MKTLQIKHKRVLSWGIRILLCVGILIWTIQSLLVYGVKPYLSYKDYSYQTGNAVELSPVSEDTYVITQEIQMKGDRLNHLNLFINKESDALLSISLVSMEGTTIIGQTVSCSDFSAGAWNTISGFSASTLTRDGKYIVEISSDTNLSMLSVCPIDKDDYFMVSEQNSSIQESNLVVGIQCTYTYITFARAIEFAFNTITALLLSIGLCYCIVFLDKICDAYKITKNKSQGIIPAIYLAVSTVLIFNPLEAVRNEIVQFKRVLGQGMMWNADVSRRTSNFIFWFIVFAAAFGLFYLLVNYIRQSKDHPDAKKMIRFLDHFMIVAFCTLVLRCITYFQDEAAVSSVFYFTHSAIMLIVLVTAAYIYIGLYKKISISDYSKIHFVLASISIPVAIALYSEWNQGRVVFGAWFVLALVSIILIVAIRKPRANNALSNVLSYGAITLSAFPFLTSAYIELIHVLNQHSVFVAHPAKYYLIAVLMYLVFSLVISAIGIRKKWSIKNWKRISYPIIILGLTCLSAQISLSNTYNPDLFEGANAGVLISDFLHFGSIPNIEHYGGHMMTGVWEAIVYAILNNDYSGAFVSPYSRMLIPLLVLLFYYFVREVWDEDAAFYTAIFFPFYEYWSYFGLGMLLCLAVVAYAKKNSYGRAIALWAAFIWCALYRLDLGFAYGFAAVATLVTYLIHTQRKKAVKELVVSLVGWGLFMGLIWGIVCIIKHINPIKRLIEFIMINLSNQNWAYTGIGNTGNTLFGWSYLIIPLTVTGCLLYVSLSKSFKAQVGENRWLLLLMLGWSYFGNFTRGLVRHSLAETSTTIVLWTGYLFIALFLSCIIKREESFIPAFMVLILLNTQFVQAGNFTTVSIAESSVRRPESIIESWRPGRFSQDDFKIQKAAQEKKIKAGTPIDEDDLLWDYYETYWEKIQRQGKVVERVKLSKDLINYTEKYKGVLDALLEPGEPFVDFINKTLLFCTLERKNPVYVSQSPLQLSGEYTQKRFIREIGSVPVVLMPLADYRAAVSLDGLTNAYRYYLVSEYIYNNYQPLCKYGNDYAVWVRKDAFGYYRDRLTTSLQEKEYVSMLGNTEGLGLGHISIEPTEGDSVKLAYTGGDPMVTELQKFIDTSPYYDHEMRISITYTTDVAGPMQVFYTTDYGESYIGEKVSTVNIAGDGEADFTIPITQYSRIRLDIPEGSTVVIHSLKVCSVAKLTDYGYDSPIGTHHNHTLGHLPRAWAESDKKKAINNSVQAELTKEQGYYCFDPEKIDRSNGNYLCIKASYDGNDTGGTFDNNDEFVTATVIFGAYNEGAFTEKYQYAVTLKEGEHDYLIRCSTDYYWYCGEINALQIKCDGKLYNVQASILEGD